MQISKGISILLHDGLDSIRKFWDDFLLSEKKGKYVWGGLFLAGNRDDYKFE